MLNAVNNTAILFLVVGIFISISIFFFSIYFFNRKRLKKFVLFDIAFVVLAIGMITGRVIGMINSWHEYSNLGIRIFPIEEVSGRIRIVDALPWEFFKINDGNFFIWGISIGVILSIMLIYFFSNKSKGYLNFADGIILSFLPAKLVLIITQLISFTYYGKDIGTVNVFIPTIGGPRSSLALIELFLFLGVFLLLLLVKYKVSKDGVVYLIYVIYEIVVGYFLVSNVFYSNGIISGFETSEIVSLLILLLTSLWVLSGLFGSIFKKKKATQIESISSENLIQRNDLTDIEMSESRNIIEKIKDIF